MNNSIVTQNTPATMRWRAENLKFVIYILRHVGHGTNQLTLKKINGNRSLWSYVLSVVGWCGVRYPNGGYDVSGTAESLSHQSAGPLGRGKRAYPGLHLVSVQ